MATPAAPITTRAPRAKKANGNGKQHTLTLTFGEKYEALYNCLKDEAENDDRDLAQFVVRLLATVRTPSTD